MPGRHKTTGEKAGVEDRGKTGPKTNKEELEGWRTLCNKIYDNAKRAGVINNMAELEAMMGVGKGNWRQWKRPEKTKLAREETRRSVLSKAKALGLLDEIRKRQAQEIANGSTLHDFHTLNLEPLGIPLPALEDDLRRGPNWMADKLVKDAESVDGREARWRMGDRDWRAAVEAIQKELAAQKERWIKRQEERAARQAKETEEQEVFDEGHARNALRARIVATYLSGQGQNGDK